MSPFLYHGILCHTILSLQFINQAASDFVSALMHKCTPSYSANVTLIAFDVYPVQPVFK